MVRAVTGVVVLFIAAAIGGIYFAQTKAIYPYVPTAISNSDDGRPS